MTHFAPRKFVAWACGLAACTVLAACAAPSAAPEDMFYRLDTVAAESGPVALDGSIEVDRFVASGSLGNRPLLFSEPGSNAVSEYHYHFWIESPPILLQSALVSYLRSADVAKQVVTPEMRVKPEYTISARVLRLETVRGSKPKGAVTFELSLRREADGKLLVLDEYRAEVASGSNGVQTDVAAIEKAVGEAFQHFVADIRASVK
ncbi:MAG: PqiC family protein [Rhodospirillales bacterium]|nr:PqiC family protein [Rhodospirillales bacterium]